MPQIVWMENFSVGNQAIDAQHKKWIAIYNEAHEKMLASGKKDHRQIAMDALGQIHDYTRYHFACEEAWMENIGYTGIDAHREIHRDFMKKMDSIRHDYQRDTRILNSELIKLMENWLVDHILNEDKRIGPPARG